MTTSFKSTPSHTFAANVNGVEFRLGTQVRHRADGLEHVARIASIHQDGTARVFYPDSYAGAEVFPLTDLVVA